MAYRILASLVLAVLLVDAHEQHPLLNPTTALPATSLEHLLDSDFSQYVQGILANETVNGISLAVVHSGGQVEFGAWGNRTEEGDAMTEDTQFTIASCSKAFLSASMGILMDDFRAGRNATALPPSVTTFNFETKLADLLPDEWELEDPYASRRANVRDILSHVSGMPSHDYAYGREGDTAKDVVRRMRHLRAASELRQKWSYNNQMYMTGAHLISTYAGMPYMAFIEERIFKPLGMADSLFSTTQAEKSGRFSDAWTKFGRRIPHAFPEHYVELSAGPGGVITTARDISKWLRVLLNDGMHPHSNETIIPSWALAEVTTASAMVRGTGSEDMSVQGYGMGWGRSSLRGHDVIAHTGGIPGISTVVWVLPHDGVAIAVLANADEKAGANARIAGKIMGKALKIAAADHEYEELNLFGERSLPSAKAQSPAPSAPPSLDLLAYAGTYTHPAYGTITLCAPSSDSHYCTQVHRDFNKVDSAFASAPSSSFPRPPLSASHQLLAAFPRLWCTHARLTYHRENRFGVVMTALFADGYGRNASAFETAESGSSEASVEFVVDKKGSVEGFGLSDTDWGSATPDRRSNRQKRGGSVKETADAWFQKV